MSYIIKYVHKQMNKYDFWSKLYYWTQWHIDSPQLLLWLCVLFYSSFLYCVCVFLDIQSPLREYRSIRSGASGLPYYCAPRVCISVVIGLLAVCWHNKPKTKKKKSKMWHPNQKPNPNVKETEGRRDTWWRSGPLSCRKSSWKGYSVPWDHELQTWNVLEGGEHPSWERPEDLCMSVAARASDLYVWWNW